MAHAGGVGGQFTGVVVEAYSNVDNTTPIDAIRTVKKKVPCPWLSIISSFILMVVGAS
jgi:hypothetical protein